MTDTDTDMITGAPSLESLSKAATPGEWAVCDYRRADGSLHINTGERHWTVMSAHSIQGCSTPSLDISDEEAASNAAFVTRLVSDFRAGRLHTSEALAQALAAARAETEWRDIATAPKDGTKILVARIGAEPRAARWNDAIDIWVGAGCGAGKEWPTHWMPLPAPPTPAQTDTAPGGRADG